MKKFCLVLAVLVLTLVLGACRDTNMTPTTTTLPMTSTPDPAQHPAFDSGHPALYPAFGDSFSAQRQFRSQRYRRYRRHGRHGGPGRCRDYERHRRRPEPDALNSGAAAPVHITR